MLKGSVVCFSARDKAGFERIAVRSDAERFGETEALRLRITGVDPQLFLPPVDLTPTDEPLLLAMQLRVSPTL